MRRCFRFWSSFRWAFRYFINAERLIRKEQLLSDKSVVAGTFRFEGCFDSVILRTQSAGVRVP